MAASTITRDTWTNDSGSAAAPAGDGTILNNSVLQNHIYARIDELLSGAGSYTTLRLGGLLAIEGFGNPALGVSAAGTGNQVLLVRNTAAGTGNGAALLLGNDAAGDAGVVKITSTTFTAASTSPQDGILIETARSGGISIAAVHASGTLRFYVGGATERARFDTAGNFGIGTSSPQTLIHAHSTVSDSGIYLSSVAPRLGLGDNASYASATWRNRMGLATSNDHFGTGSKVGDHVILTEYVPGSAFAAGTNGRVIIRTATGNSAVTAPVALFGYISSRQEQGLQLQQGTFDIQILTFHSTDVSHSFTSIAEANVYGAFQKYHPTNGGMIVQGYTLGDLGAELTGAVQTASPSGSISGSANAPVSINAAALSGSSFGALGANNLLCVIKNNGTTRFGFDSDGDSFQDVGTAWTNFDAHDDLALIEAVEYELSAPNAIDLQFAKWIADRRDLLTRLGLVVFNDDGHHFINRSRMQNLLCGSLRQAAQRIVALEARLAVLEAR